uniref:hypothetical protein n=1 Tax=Escherichia coli TaxID=562 RepID=UPI0021B28D62
CGVGGEFAGSSERSPTSIWHSPLPHRNHRLLYRKKKKDPHRIEREITPLAAAPATERSERVGEEAEVNRKPH